MRPTFVTTVALAAALGCSSPATRTPEGGEALTGRWGGEHVGLVLSGSGGEVDYDCAHGGVGAPFRPDASGRVDVPGVHVREHGGPVREGERPDSALARYLGQVRGDRLTLRVVVGRDTLGPYELRRDAEPRLVRCL